MKQLITVDPEHQNASAWPRAALGPPLMTSLILPPASDQGFDLVVADASWVWTERLFSPLADQGVRVLLLKACDWRNARQQRRPVRDWLFPLHQLAPHLWEQTCILPPGWMKSYPTLGMRPIAWAVNRWRGRLGPRRPLVLAISYPHYLHLHDRLRPDALIYYNMDDYGLYWSRRRAVVRRLEQSAVRQADLSVVCARARAESLRDQVPEAASRIVHLPHGAPASAIAPSPQDRPAPAPADLALLPRPLLGFVGSLEDRLDWSLVAALARELPGASIVLIGREPAPCPDETWYQQYQAAVSLPNVHRLGWRPQSEIGRYNAAFDVCLIPYRTDHPFNLVSCPTKLMDYMATTRPVVTTPLPECQLYDHLFDVAEAPAPFIAAVRRIVDRGSDDGLAGLRWEFARASTWEHTASHLLARLHQATAGRFLAAAR